MTVLDTTGAGGLVTLSASPASPVSPALSADSLPTGDLDPRDIQHREAVLELLKLKNTEAAAFQTHIIRTATLYFAVMGALFKFAFDASSTPALRSVLSTVAIATSFVFCLAALFGHLYRKLLVATLGSLHAELDISEFPERLPGIRYSIVLSLAIAIVVIATWIVVLFTGAVGYAPTIGA